MAIPRTLAVGSLVGGSTAIRVGVSAVGVALARTPSLAGLALRGIAGRDGAPRAQSAFRDELLALARESAEASWRELRRGVDELDSSTRPVEPATVRSAPARPYRVKA
jgi:hypothetical protein